LSNLHSERRTNPPAILDCYSIAGSKVLTASAIVHADS
jgi:hypothetical protein